MAQRRFPTIIRIISVILIATFIAQDIVWAYPDTFSSPRSNQNTKLATEPFVRQPGSRQEASLALIERLVEKKLQDNISLVAIDRILTSEKLSKFYTLGSIVYENAKKGSEDEEAESDIKEIVITIPGYIVRYYDPTDPTNKIKTAEYAKRQVGPIKEISGQVHKQVIRVLAQPQSVSTKKTSSQNETAISLLGAFGLHAMTHANVSTKVPAIVENAARLHLVDWLPVIALVLSISLILWNLVPTIVDFLKHRDNNQNYEYALEKAEQIFQETPLAQLVDTTRPSLNLPIFAREDLKGLMHQHVHKVRSFYEAATPSSRDNMDMHLDFILFSFIANNDLIDALRLICRFPNKARIEKFLDFLGSVMTNDDETIVHIRETLPQELFEIGLEPYEISRLTALLDLYLNRMLKYSNDARLKERTRWLLNKIRGGSEAILKFVEAQCEAGDSQLTGALRTETSHRFAERILNNHLRFMAESHYYFPLHRDYIADLLVKKAEDDRIFIALLAHLDTFAKLKSPEISEWANRLRETIAIRSHNGFPTKASKFSGQKTKIEILEKIRNLIRPDAVVFAEEHIFYIRQRVRDGLVTADDLRNLYLIKIHDQLHADDLTFYRSALRQGDLSKDKRTRLTAKKLLIVYYISKLTTFTKKTQPVEPPVIVRAGVISKPSPGVTHISGFASSVPLLLIAAFLSAAVLFINQNSAFISDLSTTMHSWFAMLTNHPAILKTTLGVLSAIIFFNIAIPIKESIVTVEERGIADNQHKIFIIHKTTARGSTIIMELSPGANIKDYKNMGYLPQDLEILHTGVVKLGAKTYDPNAINVKEECDSFKDALYPLAKVPIRNGMANSISVPKPAEEARPAKPETAAIAKTSAPEPAAATQPAPKPAIAAPTAEVPKPTAPTVMPISQVKVEALPNFWLKDVLAQKPVRYDWLACLTYSGMAEKLGNSDIGNKRNGADCWVIKLNEITDTENPGFKGVFFTNKGELGFINNGMIARFDKGIFYIGTLESQIGGSGVSLVATGIDDKERFVVIVDNDYRTKLIKDILDKGGNKIEAEATIDKMLEQLKDSGISVMSVKEVLDSAEPLKMVWTISAAEATPNSKAHEYNRLDGQNAAVTAAGEPQRPLPPGSPYEIWKKLKERGKFVSPGDIVKGTGLSAKYAVMRDLYTLYRLGLAEKIGNGKNVIFRAYNFDSSIEKDIAPVLQLLGPRPTSEQKKQAALIIDDILKKVLKKEIITNWSDGHLSADLGFYAIGLIAEERSGNSRNGWEWPSILYSLYKASQRLKIFDNFVPAFDAMLKNLLFHSVNEGERRGISWLVKNIGLLDYDILYIYDHSDNAEDDIVDYFWRLNDPEKRYWVYIQIPYLLSEKNKGNKNPSSLIKRLKGIIEDEARLSAVAATEHIAAPGTPLGRVLLSPMHDQEIGGNIKGGGNNSSAVAGSTLVSKTEKTTSPAIMGEESEITAKVEKLHHMYRELRHSLTNHITEILAIATSMKRKHIADAGNAFRVVSKVSDFIEKYEKLKVIYRELSKDLEQKAHLEKRDYIKLAMVVQSTVDLKKDLAILYAMTLTVPNSIYKFMILRNILYSLRALRIFEIHIKTRNALQESAAQLIALHDLFSKGLADHPIADNEKIVLSKNLFIKDGNEQLLRDIEIVLGRVLKTGRIEIVDPETLRKRATNNDKEKTSKDKVTVVMTNEDWEDKTIWYGNVKETGIKSSILIIDDRLTDGNYLYLEGIIGMARAVMANNRSAIKSYYEILSGTKIGDDVLELLSEAGENNIAFAIKAIFKFKPLDKFSPKEFDDFRIRMETLINA